MVLHTRQQPCLLKPGSDPKDAWPTRHDLVFSLFYCRYGDLARLLAVLFLTDVEEAVHLGSDHGGHCACLRCPSCILSTAYVCRWHGGLHVPLEFTHGSWSDDTDQ